MRRREDEGEDDEKERVEATEKGEEVYEMEGKKELSMEKKGGKRKNTRKSVTWSAVPYAPILVS